MSWNIRAYICSKIYHIFHKIKSFRKLLRLIYVTEIYHSGAVQDFFYAEGGIFRWGLKYFFEMIWCYDWANLTATVSVRHIVETIKHIKNTAEIPPHFQDVTEYTAAHEKGEKKWISSVLLLRVNLKHIKREIRHGVQGTSVGVQGSF